jgi:hypothetical protein
LHSVDGTRKNSERHGSRSNGKETIASDPRNGNVSFSLKKLVAMDNKYRKETRYWCDYCRMFVYNNQISKQNHEQSPKHKNAMERYLRNQYKQKDLKDREKQRDEALMQELDRKAGVSSAYRTGTVSKQEKRHINIQDYGYDTPIDTQEKTEFKVTTDFALLNRQTIHTTRMGEWEQVSDPEPEADLPDEPEPIEAPAEITQENVEEKSEKPVFELKEKRIAVEVDEDQEGPVTFKKRKLGAKSFRKK